METKSDDLKFAAELIAAARVQGEAWALTWTESAVETESENAYLLVLRDQNAAPLGFLFLRPPGHAWEITLVAVKPDARGSGIFSVLIRQAEEFRKTQNGSAAVSSIDLEVRADNKSAIRAYEKHGFKVIGQRERYYSDGAAAILYRFE